MVRSSSLFLILVMSLPAWARHAETTVDRSTELVTVPGSALPDFLGSAIADLALFRHDPGSGAFVPIAFQIDERFLKTFNPSTPGEFQELVYDVFGEDDGLLDVDDELVFRFGDVGAETADTTPWPSGADTVRIALRVDDPRPSGSQPTGYVYLFRGSGLAATADASVSWDATEFGTIATPRFDLEFDGRWLWTGLRVAAPCGTGADLIDRWKGRVDPIIDLEQDEEDWNGNSEWLGGIAGPLRAIRYVRGARSGVNTIHHDLVSAHGIRRTIRLRVHPIRTLRVYFDLLPAPGGTLYTTAETTGVPIDGSPDALPDTWVDWTLADTPDGAILTFWDVPDSPLFASKHFYTRDDAGHDDRVPTKTPAQYGDDDDAAFGVHGVRIESTGDSEIVPIELFLRAFPLCGGTQGAGTAEAYQETLDYPLYAIGAPEGNCGAVRDLRVEEDGADVVLTWTATSMSDTYRVYRADDPSTPRVQWSNVQEDATLTYRDVGAAASATGFYYSIACTAGGGEGPW